MITFRHHILRFLFAVLLLQGITPQLVHADSCYDYYFQGAMIKMSSGDYNAAKDLLLYCKEMNPDAAETYFFLSDLYDREGNDSLKMVMMTHAMELEPDNITYKEALVPIYLKSNELEKATALMEDIVKETPERTDMLDILLQIYNYQKDNKRALETLNRMIIQEGETEQLAMSKVQLYNQMGDDKRAQKELKHLVESHPLDLNYRVMYGNWLLQKDKKKDALKEYQYVLREEPDNENALMSMMDYYRSIGQNDLADEQRTNLILSPKTQQDTRLLLLKQYIRASEQALVDSTVVLNFFDRILAQKQTNTSIYELKLAYMTMKQMPKDSIRTVLTDILDIQPEHAQARFELIQMAWEKGDANEMIRLSKPAQQYNPDEWTFSYFLGIGYYLNDQTQECVEALETAAAHVDESKQKTLAIEMYALLGDALHKTGNSAKAYEAYENCLRLDPDNISCLNNYAYYLSEENRDLDKAAAMSLKTIKAEPNNATYLDTYAWILYMQERYEEANIYIDMAVNNLDQEQDNTVILEHQQEIAAKCKE